MSGILARSVRCYLEAELRVDGRYGSGGQGGAVGEGAERLSERRLASIGRFSRR